VDQARQDAVLVEVWGMGYQHGEGSGGSRVGGMSGLIATVLCLGLHCWGCIGFGELYRGQVSGGVPSCCSQVVGGSLAGAHCVMPSCQCNGHRWCSANPAKQLY